MAQDALEGIRVLDVSTGTAGPLAAMFLADFGADVVMAEGPDSGPHRSDPSSAVWNRGKRAVAGDPHDPAGHRRLASLLAATDVCVCSAPEDRIAGTWIDPTAATAANPRLVYLHTPPFTGGAPWAGGHESDALLAAASGVAMRQASAGAGPVDSVAPYLVVVQGIWAAAAAVSALFERESSGWGQVVTVSGLHGAMTAAVGGMTFDPAAPPPRRPGPGGAGGSTPFYRTYCCADDRWLFLAALTPHFSARAFSTLGVEWILDDERLDGAGRAGMLQPKNAGWVIDAIAASFRTRTRAEWLDALAGAGCPAGPVLDRDDWLDHAQLAATGMRIDLDDPGRGPLTMPGVPLHLTATPGAVRRPAPMPGEHNDPDWAKRPVPTPAVAARDDDGGPLAGVRVLDLGAIIAGPYGASLLAQLGADVIKIEPPTGDSFRGPGFSAYNRGQRGICLDLRDADGRDALLALARTADVVVDNYRPGVLERLRIGYGELSAINPGVVTMTVTGFGPGGPLGDEAGFDPVLQAMSGMMAAQGGDGPPVFYTVPVNDVAAAATVALGASLALFHRRRGGTGQRVWTSLAGMSALIQSGALVRYPNRPAPVRGGPDFPGPGPLDRYYAVSDGWVRVQCPDPETGWAGLARSGLLGDAGPLGDAGAAEPAAAESRLSASLAGLTRTEAVERLTRAGVPAAPARTGAELAADPAVVAYGVIEPDPRRPGWWTAGRHVLFSRTVPEPAGPAPGLDEHAAEVLSPAAPADLLEDMVEEEAEEEIA